MGYTCDNDGAPSVLAISNLSTGDVAAPCEECLLPTLIGFVQALMPEGYSVEALTSAELADLLETREMSGETGVEPEAGDSTSHDPTDPDPTGAELHRAAHDDQDEADDDGTSGFSDDTIARALGDSPEPAPAEL